MAPAEDDSRIDELLMSELLLRVAQGEEYGGGGGIGARRGLCASIIVLGNQLMK